MREAIAAAFARKSAVPAPIKAGAFRTLASSACCVHSEREHRVLAPHMIEPAVADERQAIPPLQVSS
jgi:hypothetical protein